MLSDPRFDQDLHQFAELQFCSPACKFHPLMCKNLKFLFAVSRGPGLITGCCVRADKSDIDSYEPHCLPRHQELVNNIIQENNHSNTASNKLQYWNYIFLTLIKLFNKKSQNFIGKCHSL